MIATMGKESILRPAAVFSYMYQPLVAGSMPTESSDENPSPVVSRSHALLSYKRSSSHHVGDDSSHEFSSENDSHQHTPSTTKHGHALPENIAWRVARSWELLEDDLEAVGVDFFLRMFDENPELLALFRFGPEVLRQMDANGERTLPKALQSHALIVMETLGQCVAGDTTMAQLVPKLRAIGKVHARVGVEDYMYNVLFQHLADAIANALGPEQWDGETREAWELVFQSITSVIKNPDSLFQMEPLEGWGLINAIACAYVSVYTPFRMAGFAVRHDAVETLFNVLTSLAVACLLLDLGSSRLVRTLRVSRTFRDRSKRGTVRRTVDRFVLDPVLFRVVRFVRSLQIERWSSWPRMDALALASFPLQYTSRYMFGYPAGAHAGVHWTFAFGLLRMVTGARVLIFLRCAENNLMLRRRLNPSERSFLRMGKLLLTMMFVIHVSACLWCIVARMELGPGQVEPVASDFFPDAEHILLARSGIINAYLHSIHWAWVNLAGIGDCDSTPQTSFECLITLMVHVCGATLYTVTTGNVVTILEGLTQTQGETGADLAELGAFMRKCSIPATEQERILQGYMVQHIAGGDSSDEDEHGSAPLIPDAVSRLPSYLRKEVTNYARVEAVKRRDAAFAHCSRDFMFAIVGSLKRRTLLLPGDFYCTEEESLPQQVILIESGRLEVITNGICKRVLQRGDVIGKRWLLTASGHDGESDKKKALSFSAQTSLRAHSDCTLRTGLFDAEEVRNLSQRYPNDFAMLKADRNRINGQRRAREEELDRSHSNPDRFKKAGNKVILAMKLKPGRS